MVSCGGLGLRTAQGVALPALVASPITCRPMVSTMVDYFSAAFGATTRARTKLLHVMTPPSPLPLQKNLVAQLDEEMAERQLLWRKIIS